MGMTENEAYWEKRNEELAAKWLVKSKREIEKELALYYQQALEAIMKDINSLYAKFATLEGMDMAAAKRYLQSGELAVWRMTMQEYLDEFQKTGDKKLLAELNGLAYRSRITRLDKLYAETCYELARLANKTGIAMDKFMGSAYKDNYYRNLFEIGKKRGLASAPVQVDNEKLENVLRTPWSGKNYSERIWKNQAKLAEVLQKRVLEGMHRGLSSQELSRIVAKKMDVGLSDATRLVRTELNYVQNQAALDSIKDAGMKFYRFSATLDKRTSPVCREHDGKVYPVEAGSPGSNMPPLHPHCRSTISGSIRGDGRVTGGSRAARDKQGNYIRVPADMKYKEWYNQYITKAATPPKHRTAEELEAEGRIIKGIVEKYTNRKSLWSGNIVLSKPGEPSGKLWSCDIQIESNAEDFILLHEMLHSCSASYAGKKVWLLNRWAEESSVHFLAQEIARAENIPIIESGYDAGVELIRKYKQRLKLKMADLDFAKKLLAQPLDYRFAWLYDLIQISLPSDTLLSEVIALGKFVEEIEQWGAKNLQFRK